MFVEILVHHLACTAWATHRSSNRGPWWILRYALDHCFIIIASLLSAGCVTFASRICWYLVECIPPSTSAAFPVLLAVMQPQSIVHPPPCSLLEICSFFQTLLFFILGDYCGIVSLLLYFNVFHNDSGLSIYCFGNLMYSQVRVPSDDSDHVCSIMLVHHHSCVRRTCRFSLSFAF